MITSTLQIVLIVVSTRGEHVSWSKAFVWNRCPGRIVRFICVYCISVFFVGLLACWDFQHDSANQPTKNNIVDYCIFTQALIGRKTYFILTALKAASLEESHQNNNVPKKSFSGPSYSHDLKPSFVFFLTTFRLLYFGTEYNICSNKVSLRSSQIRK